MATLLVRRLERPELIERMQASGIVLSARESSFSIRSEQTMRESGAFLGGRFCFTRSFGAATRRPPSLRISRSPRRRRPTQAERSAIEASRGLGAHDIALDKLAAAPFRGWRAASSRFAVGPARNQQASGLRPKLRGWLRIPGLARAAFTGKRRSGRSSGRDGRDRELRTRGQAHRSQRKSHRPPPFAARAPPSWARALANIVQRAE